MAEKFLDNESIQKTKIVSQTAIAVSVVALVVSIGLATAMYLSISGFKQVLELSSKIDLMKNSTTQLRNEVSHTKGEARKQKIQIELIRDGFQSRINDIEQRIDLLASRGETFIKKIHRSANDRRSCDEVCADNDSRICLASKVVASSHPCSWKPEGPLDCMCL